MDGISADTIAADCGSLLQALCCTHAGGKASRKKGPSAKDGLVQEQTDIVKLVCALCGRAQERTSECAIDVTHRLPVDLQVKMITMERNLDPVIIFSFSKKECEALANQMAALDFNDESEKKIVDSIFGRWPPGVSVLAAMQWVRSQLKMSYTLKCATSLRAVPSTAWQSRTSGYRRFKRPCPCSDVASGCITRACYRSSKRSSRSSSRRAS